MQSSKLVLFFPSQYLHIYRVTLISSCYTNIDKHISLQGMGNVYKNEALAIQTLMKIKKKAVEVS